MKVLLADDSGTMRHILRKLLTGLGCDDIVEASDGLEALALAKSSPPGLAILDWQMPKMSGLISLRLMKKLPGLAEVPMFLTNSESGRREILVAVQSGASGFLVKPISPGTLKEKLAPFLDHSAIRPQGAQS